MSEIADRYRRLSQAFADRIAGVPAGGWDDPSPCEDWNVRELVQHVVDTQGMFLGFIAAEMPPLPTVADDAVGAFDQARGEIQRRLDDPEIAGTVFDGYFGPTVWEESVDRFLNLDLVIHGWDLARATGQDETIAPADVARATEIAHGFPADAARGGGVFGPEIEPPDGADEQARLLAYVGRQV